MSYIVDRLRNIVSALDAVHNGSPELWTEKLDEAHADAESLLAMLSGGSASHPAVEQAGANVGHGHVFPRADGVKMRCGGPALCSECAADAYRARAALAQPSPALPPFAEKVLAKLRRFYDYASDFESGGVDIGRHWLDLLTQLGLLNRVQRSPALWEISQQGEDLLEGKTAQADQAAQQPLKLSDDVREFLQEGINSVMGGEDADVDYEFANQLGKLLGPIYAAPAAQAQHSVPEEFIGRLSEFLAQRGATGKALLRELRDMLAAAPGKEGA